MTKKRKPIRLKGYDYSSEGAYYVTICTQDRKCILGEIVNGKMILNEFGNIVKFTWDALIQHNANILLDQFVIMPNHVHGIIFINNDANYGLPEIVRQFKTFSAKPINEIQNKSGNKYWQRNYYEHIIRDEQELNQKREYILNNPLNWEKDENNTFNEEVLINGGGYKR
ncbi:MAG: transposase [candidate division Zixibacteria bacterium]|nr:transposase [candidate division Zixibacteria bacterium]